MKPGFLQKGIYAIVDDAVHKEYGLKKIITDIVIHSEIPILQLRLKTSSIDIKRELITFALQQKQNRNYTLIINDEPQFLEINGIDGVHLGQNDIETHLVRSKYPHSIIGLSTHNAAEVMRAGILPINYIGCGCVFPTTSKSDTQPLGLEGLKKLVQQTRIPTVAIGGINLSNIQAVAETGCSMAAVISGLIDHNHFIGQKLHDTFKS